MINLSSRDPEKRYPFSEIIHRLQLIGDDSYKERIIFDQYKSAVCEKIENDPSSLSLNQDIVQTRQDFIPLDTTILDPFKYSNLPTQSLFEQIDEFFLSERTVFLLLGAAGSGKSSALQLKFIESIQQWQPGSPLPIYFNLANISTTPSLKDIFLELDDTIKTNITPNLTNSTPNLTTVHLYVDSYDEGMTEKFKDNVIQRYLSELGTNLPHKILITCRSNAISESDHDLFAPAQGELQKAYVAQLNYSSNKDPSTLNTTQVVHRGLYEPNPKERA
jgi:hypothetical protein